MVEDGIILIVIIGFFIAALFAEIIGTIAGFGSSTIFLPLALLFFDFKTALVLVAFAHIFGNLGRINFFRHGYDKKLFIRFTLPSVVFALIGALLVNYLPQDILKLVLGIFLSLYSVIFLWKENIKFPETTLTAIFGGSISGFVAGLIGTGGALRGAFLGSFGLSKERLIATSAITAILVDLTRIPVYIKQGFFDAEYLLYLPVLFIIAMIGSFFGKLILDRIPQEKFRIIIFTAVFIIGIKFIYDYF